MTGSVEDDGMAVITLSSSPQMKTVHRPVAKLTGACALGLVVHGVAAIHVAAFVARAVGDAAA